MLHLYATLRLFLLYENYRNFCAQLSLDVKLRSDRFRFKKQIDGTIFLHAVARDDGFKILFQLIIISTLIVFPIAVQIFVQIKFLPYQSELITWIQRFCVMSNTVISILILLPMYGQTAWSRRAILTVFSCFFVAISTISALVITFPQEFVDNNWIADKLYRKILPALSVKKPLLQGFGNFSGVNQQRSDLLWVKEIGTTSLHGFWPTTLHLVSLTRVPEDGLSTRLDMSGRSFVGANFEHSTLSNIGFTDAKLVGVNFASSTLRNIDFGNSLIKYSKFDGAWIENSKFNKSRIIHSSLTLTSIVTSDLKDIHIQSSNLVSAKFLGSDLFDSQIKHSNLQSSKFIASDVGGSNFLFNLTSNMEANFSNFNWANITGGDFSGVRFKGSTSDEMTLICPFDTDRITVFDSYFRFIRVAMTAQDLVVSGNVSPEEAIRNIDFGPMNDREKAKIYGRNLQNNCIDGEGLQKIPSWAISPYVPTYAGEMRVETRAETLRRYLCGSNTSRAFVSGIAKMIRLNGNISSIVAGDLNLLEDIRSLPRNECPGWEDIDHSVFDKLVYDIER